MFRTGPIRNFTSSEVKVVACILTAETAFDFKHDVTFSVVQLDGEPSTVHSERGVVPTGSMGTFEAVLRQPIRHWEVRIDAHPEVAFITVYHTLDGRLEPSMTYRTSDLYYADFFDGAADGSDAGSYLFTDMDHPFGGKPGLSSNWFLLDDDDDPDQPSWK